MDTISASILRIIQVAVLVWLLWKLPQQYVFGDWLGLLVLLVVVPAYIVFSALQWLRLKRTVRYGALLQFTVVTTFGMFLGVGLLVRLVIDVPPFMRAGPDRVTKEMQSAAFQRGVAFESREQFFDDLVDKVRSERNAAAVVAGLLVVLYWESYWQMVSRPGSDGALQVITP